MGRPVKNDPWENRFQSWKAEKKEKEEMRKRADEKARQGELAKTLSTIENNEIRIIDDLAGKPRTMGDRRAAILVGMGILVIIFLLLVYFNVIDF